MKATAPVYSVACPKCEARVEELCRRVRADRREHLSVVLTAHAERYAAFRAWAQPDLFDLPLDSVREQAY